MSKNKRNIAASIRQKLKNQAIQGKRPFAELFQYYAMECFLYRLTQSSHADRFILKGALMLRVWQPPQFRPTMDIDMLGKTSNEIDSICTQVTDIISVEIDDGLAFDPGTIRGERIKEDSRSCFELLRLKNGRHQNQAFLGDTRYFRQKRAEIEDFWLLTSLFCQATTAAPAPH